jgi:hypothetical protein
MPQNSFYLPNNHVWWSFLLGSFDREKRCNSTEGMTGRIVKAKQSIFEFIYSIMQMSTSQAGLWGLYLWEAILL